MDTHAVSSEAALRKWVATVLVVGVSMATLVVEILAARLLAPYVGVTIETYTAIIGTVLAGIATGAWLGGALADRTDPRALIGPLLFIGGMLCIAALPIVRGLGRSFVDGDSVGVIVLASSAFLLPAVVLSAVPPIVVKLQLRDLGSTGTTVGRLSAQGTAGAIAGTFITGFVLIEAAAVTTLLVSVGVVLMLAGVAFTIGMRREGRTAGARQVGDLRRQSMYAGLLAASSFVGVATVDEHCDANTTYYCASIIPDGARPGGRLLMLDDLRHSYVDLDDPQHLKFWYARRVADTVDLFAPVGNIAILYIGGGALTLPRYFGERRPDASHTVLKIDSGLVNLIRDRLPFDDTGVRIEFGDARVTLDAEAAGTADVVVGDAFGSRSVPWHLATREFAADISRVLKANGVYVVNVIDGAKRSFVRAEAATLQSVFGHVAVLLGPAAAQGRRGNSVIVASHSPLDLASLRAALAHDPAGGEAVANTATFISGARILTDDYAPVDQLISEGW